MPVESISKQQLARTVPQPVRPPLSQSASLAYAARMEHRPEDSALMLRYRDGDVAAFEAVSYTHLTLPTIYSV